MPESLFEKPYLDQDYRKMHLNIPTPDWPSTPDIDDGGMFPEAPGTWTFKFDPGICTLGVVSPECGKETTLGVSIGLLPPGSADKGVFWKATSSHPGCVEITGIDHGVSGTIHLMVHETCDEEVVSICVTGTLYGEIREELTVPNPFSGTGVLDYTNAGSLPALNSTKKSDGYVYDCGCIDLELDCGCLDGSQVSYDTDNSSMTIVRGGTGTALFIDLADGSPYTWSISGTGFWFDEEYTVTSFHSNAKSAVVYADSEACGLGTITLTTCDATAAVGYMRCTVGNWGPWNALCGAYSTGTYLNSCCNNITAERWYQEWCRYLVQSDCCDSREAGCISEGACLPGAFSLCCIAETPPYRDVFYRADKYWECS